MHLEIEYIWGDAIMNKQLLKQLVEIMKGIKYKVKLKYTLA